MSTMLLLINPYILTHSHIS